jgi:hypothetical protein
VKIQVIVHGGVLGLTTEDGKEGRKNRLHHVGPVIRNSQSFLPQASLQLSEPLKSPSPSCSKKKKIPFPFSTHTNASSQERIPHWIWKLLHGTPSLVDEAEETREIEEQGSKKQGAMAFLLPKLTTPSGPSCKLPPSPLLKPQLAQPGHGGGKIQGSGSGSGAAQVAAPGHLSLLLLLSAPQQAADPAPKSTATKNRGKGGGDPQRSDFYLNLGTAVRTLRDDLPDVFDREPNYDIYRWVKRAIFPCVCYILVHFGLGL